MTRSEQARADAKCKVPRCKQSGSWLCRICNRNVCAHHSGAKSGKDATCGRCWGESPHILGRRCECGHGPATHKEGGCVECLLGVAFGERPNDCTAFHAVPRLRGE